MAAAGRSKGPPRDLVRLSPFQFSMAVAVVVLLAAGSFLSGYIWGERRVKARFVQAVQPERAGISPLDPSSPPSAVTSSAASSAQPVTFYSALTEKGPSPSQRARPSQAPPAARPRQEANLSEKAAAPILPASTGAPSVMIQVGSYPTEEKAKEFLASLQAGGFKGKVVSADLGPRGTWYRVRLGPMSSQEASQYLSVLEKDRGIKGFVVKD